MFNLWFWHNTYLLWNIWSLCIVNVFLQVLFEAGGRAISPSCSGCWCRWSCGCFFCHARLELRLSSTVLCQMKLPNTVAVTSLTADPPLCVLSQETQVWQRNCGKPVRGLWNCPDVGDWEKHYLCSLIKCLFILFVYKFYAQIKDLLNNTFGKIYCLIKLFSFLSNIQYELTWLLKCVKTWEFQAFVCNDKPLLCLFTWILKICFNYDCKRSHRWYVNI